MNSGNHSSLRLKAMLPKAASCLVSVTETVDDFESMQKVTVAVDNHVSVYISNETPTEHMLLMINRPLLWVHQGLNEVHTFNQTLQ